MAGANNAKTKLSLEQRQTKNAAYKLNKIDNEKLKAGILCRFSNDCKNNEREQKNHFSKGQYRQIEKGFSRNERKEKD
jgi:hypothetical protein